MKETLKSLFLSEWTPLEKGLMMADVLLFGVVIGWLTAPLRHGFSLFGGNASDAERDAETAEYTDDDSEDEIENEEDEK